MTHIVASSAKRPAHHGTPKSLLSCTATRSRKRRGMPKCRVQERARLGREPEDDRPRAVLVKRGDVHERLSGAIARGPEHANEDLVAGLGDRDAVTEVTLNEQRLGAVEAAELPDRQGGWRGVRESPAARRLLADAPRRSWSGGTGRSCRSALSNAACMRCGAAARSLPTWLQGPIFFTWIIRRLPVGRGRARRRWRGGGCVALQARTTGAVIR
jgi:hypothetical protein